MSDLRQVLARSQTDFDFNLAVLSNLNEALASYTLSESERAALTGEGMALWNLIKEVLPEEDGGGPLPPGGVGVAISGHHDFFNVFQNWEDFWIDEIVNDSAVMAAVQAICAAESLAQRIGAVNQLMERIG